MLGLRTVVYKVDELAKAKEWYARAFAAEPYFDEPFYVGFDIGGYELGLVPNDTPASAKKESAVTYWGVEDIHANFQWLLSIGATEIEAPRNVGGELMVATVKDPWGNLIGIIFNPDFRVK
jgi:lactoylglutathione lyase